MSNPDVASGRELTELEDALDGAPATPVVVTYPCGPAYRLPDGFSTKKYRGLLLCVVVYGEEPAIHTCWKSGDSLLVGEPLLRAELQLTTACSVSSVAQVATTKTPWWKRYSLSLGKVVLGIAALFGALSAIRDYFGDFFAPPTVSAYAQETAPVDYKEGSRIVIPIKILNQGRFGRATVTLNEAKLRSQGDTPGSIPLQLDTHNAPQLQPGQTVEAHVLGTAPVLQQRDGPQDFELDVPMTASGGYLVADRSVAFQKRTFKIWPDLAWHVSFDPVPSNKAVAYVSLSIYSGRAFSAGTTGFLLIDLPEAPERVELVCCNATQTKLTYGSGANVRCKLEFKTGPLPAFQASLQKIAIAFRRDLSSVEWERVSNSVQARVEGGEI